MEKGINQWLQAAFSNATIFTVLSILYSTSDLWQFNFVSSLSLNLLIILGYLTIKLYHTFKFKTKINVKIQVFYIKEVNHQ